MYIIALLTEKSNAKISVDDAPKYVATGVVIHGRVTHVAINMLDGPGPASLEEATETAISNLLREHPYHNTVITVTSRFGSIIKTQFQDQTQGGTYQNHGHYHIICLNEYGLKSEIQEFTSIWAHPALSPWFLLEREVTKNFMEILRIGLPRLPKSFLEAEQQAPYQNDLFFNLFP